jgi:hypothetical protein
MYVIWNATLRAYVAPAGSAKSYTKSLERARKWPTRESAQANCCGDDVVRDAAEILRS